MPIDFSHYTTWNASSSSSLWPDFFDFFFLPPSEPSPSSTADYLWYTPLSSYPLLLNSYWRSISRHNLFNRRTNCFSNIIGLIFCLNISKSSLYVELKGAKKRTVHYRLVDHVKMYRSGGVENGMLIGAGAGLVVGVVAGVVATSSGSNSSKSLSSDSD